MNCDKCGREGPSLFASATMANSEHQHIAKFRTKPWPFDWCPFCVDREMYRYGGTYRAAAIDGRNIGTMEEEG